MGIGLQHYDIAGSALNAYRTLDDSFNQKKRLELEERNQALREQESADNAKIRGLTIREGERKEQDAVNLRLADEGSSYLLQAADAANTGDNIAYQKAVDSITPDHIKALQINPQMKKIMDNVQGIGAGAVAFGKSWAGAMPQVATLVQQAQKNGGTAASPDGSLKVDWADGGARIYGPAADQIGAAYAQSDPGRFDHLNNVRDFSYFLDNKTGKMAVGFTYDDKDGKPVFGVSTKNRSTDDNDPVVQFDPIKAPLDYAKTKASLAAALMDVKAKYNDPIVKNIVTKGLADQVMSDDKREKLKDKIAAYEQTDAAKKLSTGPLGEAMTSLKEMAMSGIIPEDNYAKSLELLALKSEESKGKNESDNQTAQALLLGYSGMEDLPRTSALAKQLIGQKVSAKAAVEILKSVSAGEQRQQDNTNRLQVARAGRPESASSAQIRSIEYLVRNGMPRDEATKTVFGITKTEMMTNAGNQRTLVAGLQRSIKQLEDNLMLASKDQRESIRQQILEKTDQLNSVIGGMYGGQDQEPASTPTDYSTYASVAVNYGPAAGLTGADPVTRSVVVRKPSSVRPGVNTKALQFFK